MGKRVSIMRVSQNFLIATAVGLAAAGFAFFAQAGTNETSLTSGAETPSQADAVFAGGCFWCTEADFDKVDGVLETISGYTGGHVNNPSYSDVTRGTSGHYEAVRVIYDPGVVSYDDLVGYYWRTVDPLDANGQFCDRGSSYRTAIFVETPEEREVAEASKAALDEGGTLASPIVTEIIEQDTFWPAEDYHQNYYRNNRRQYDFYRFRCGRDQRIDQVWADTPPLENDLTH